jgi:hypothetical protein
VKAEDVWKAILGAILALATGIILFLLNKWKSDTERKKDSDTGRIETEEEFLNAALKSLEEIEINHRLWVGVDGHRQLDPDKTENTSAEPRYATKIVLIGEDVRRRTPDVKLDDFWRQVGSYSAALRAFFDADESTQKETLDNIDSASKAMRGTLHCAISDRLREIKNTRL